MAIEHTSHEGTNAILAVLLVLVALVLGYLLFRGVGIGGRSANIDVNLPNLPGTNNSDGGNSPQTQ